MAGPFALSATSTSYATWVRPSSCTYSQAAVGVMVVTVPEGDVTEAWQGAVGLKAAIAWPLQYTGALSFT